MTAYFTNKSVRRESGGGVIGHMQSYLHREISITEGSMPCNISWCWKEEAKLVQRHWTSNMPSSLTALIKRQEGPAGPLPGRLGSTDYRQERAEGQERVREAVQAAADDEECAYVSPHEALDR